MDSFTASAEGELFSENSLVFFALWLAIATWTVKCMAMGAL